MLSWWVSVLKCDFYHYSGMVRPIDQETTVTELLTVPKRGADHTMQGRKGKHQGPSGGRGTREWGKSGQEPLLWCLEIEQVKWGKQV